MLGAALAGVAERLGTRGHPLPELPGEAVERESRDAERRKPWKVSATLTQVSPAGLVGCAADATTIAQRAHQLAPRRAVVDAEAARTWPRRASAVGAGRHSGCRPSSSMLIHAAVAMFLQKRSRLSSTPNKVLNTVESTTSTSPAARRPAASRPAC